jgi:hypothetical protein
MEGTLVRKTEKFSANTFDINKKTPLVVYSHSSKNIILVKSLRSAGYNVVAFFDRQAVDIISFSNTPVYTEEDDPFSLEEKVNLVVIIGFQNILQHEIVANTLFQKGYHDLVGLIPQKFLPQGAQGYMYDLYNLLRCGQYSKLKGIPKSSLRWRENHSFIPHFFEVKIIWVPAKQCFTLSRDQFSHPNLSIEQMELLELLNLNRSILDLPLYEMLFDWLDSGTGDIERYLDAFAGVVPEKRESLKSDRLMLYRRFCDEFSKGIKFFKHSPLSAITVEHNKYIIIDGLHRCIFLLRKGCTHLPLLLTHTDQISENSR